MIIDTTQTKIEQQITTRQANIDIFQPLIEAAKRREKELLSTEEGRQQLADMRW